MMTNAATAPGLKASEGFPIGFSWAGAGPQFIAPPLFFFSTAHMILQ